MLKNLANAFRSHTECRCSASCIALAPWPPRALFQTRTIFSYPRRHQRATLAGNNWRRLLFDSRREKKTNPLVSTEKERQPHQALAPNNESAQYDRSIQMKLIAPKAAGYLIVHQLINKTTLRAYNSLCSVISLWSHLIASSVARPCYRALDKVAKCACVRARAVGVAAACSQLSNAGEILANPRLAVLAVEEEEEILIRVEASKRIESQVAYRRN